MLKLLVPAASKAQRDELAKEEGKLYQKEYLPLVRPFAGVPELFRKTRFQDRFGCAAFFFGSSLT
jgi:hypothetical protein